MDGYAIRAEGLSKKYVLGLSRPGFDRLSEVLAGGLSGLGFNRRGGRPRPGGGTFWALRDVGFEVDHGEVVGIIGRNGAGKSTLLRILSRITRPTSGMADIYGRVGSLLEVGTGFHPELTGRQNIYLNGAILGMKRAEIARKFDEIVAFAEIERFLDTPVKRYSSGMYVRLAFAVAAHLEPEILIVDEVLAVGDAAFQKKCLGKMAEAAAGGRTVLFVSHNLAVIQSLCSRGILLADGTVRVDGDVAAAVGTYLRSLEEAASQDLMRRTDRRGRGRARLHGVTVVDAGTPPSLVLTTGQPARLVFDVHGFRAGMSCNFTIYDHNGQPVANFDSGMPAPDDVRDQAEPGRVVCEVDELPLLAGRYRINVAIMDGPSWADLEDHVEGAAVFDVQLGQMRGRPEAVNVGYGCVCIPHRWRQPEATGRVTRD
jgi:lipopolysaccharide transport system ATP-binding protein